MMLPAALVGCTTGTETTSTAATVDASDAPPASSTPSTPEPSPALEPSPATTPAAAPADLPLPAPEGAAFYLPPDPVPGTAAGDLIWARPIDEAPTGSRGWQVLYRSESVAGDPIAVSGVVFAPTDPVAPSLPVLTWAHGTTGLGDACAPSKEYAVGGSSEMLLARLVTGLGWTFVATDYEGLGTPGVHPYLVGQSEGRGVLDIVRAAAQLSGASVDAESPVAIVGHSQGGHAALMAGELAGGYAAELDVVGTVALAPPGDIAVIEASAASAGGPLVGGGFSLMIDAGFLAAYPDLPVEAVVAEEGRAALDAVGDMCLGEAFELAGSDPDAQLDGTDDPDWAAAYAANSPGAVAPSAPVLILHGDADDVVPPVFSEMILDEYCSVGAVAQRTVYPGADHGSVVTQSLADIQFWLAQRMSGAPASDDC